MLCRGKERSAGAASGGYWEREPFVAACGQRRGLAWALSGGGRGPFGALLSAVCACTLFTLHTQDNDAFLKHIRFQFTSDIYQ